MAGLVYAHDLSIADRLVLKNLENDIHRHSNQRDDDADSSSDINGSSTSSLAETESSDSLKRREAGAAKPELAGSSDDEHVISLMKAMSDPKHDDFEPTVFVSMDLRDLKRHYPRLSKYVIQPYVNWAEGITRRPTDVVFLTHLLLYSVTSLPSAIYLFWDFTYLHGFLHFAMSFYFMGSYTLMMHQHIHQRGILAPKYALLDTIFPYITDPLLGHTWNTYYYHHVKHHHIEGNGPNDLSSTLRFQRDSPLDFAYYVVRFMLLIWLELPLYFISKGRYWMALRCLFFEVGNYAAYVLLATFVSWRATLFAFVLPLTLMRIGLMVGNWGQHALVDRDEPDSDFRSSITLIDVPSNRYCFNDGYHTSHHLNPLRHWRDHPQAFLHQKHTYAKEGALVFHNIDYLMITVRLLMKDYEHLARCLVPIGDQISMSMDERVAMLKSHTRRFTEEEIRQKFAKAP
ncbi:fatty acid desaturase [Coniochaeta sp. PMI_546]|nr:fatty acid desaturase [Coniochaeta sp. PMI_546]